MGTEDEKRPFVVVLRWDALSADEWLEVGKRAGDAIEDVPEHLRPRKDAHAFMGWAAEMAWKGVAHDMRESAVVDALINDQSDLTLAVRTACESEQHDPIEVLRAFIREVHQV